MKFSEITFAYATRRAPVFDALTWEVPSGRTVLLGPNGAGKSTLLAIAATAVRPARGSCEVAGICFGRGGSNARRAAAVVGWMPQSIEAVRGLRTLEQIAYAGWLRGLSRRDAQRAAVEALELVDLTTLADKPSYQLSGGQLRRLGLASALVHQPRQLLLDEPTAGLDPVQRERFREILNRVPDDCDVIVSTHQVDDLTDLYDNVAVMLRGRIWFADSVEAFMALAAPGAARPADDAYRVVTRGIPAEAAS